ncbi:Fringe-like [Trypanosoma melophagium]|uniref:Fringe-like n=1 Tax=Trypanosoma melophagium TaxID=715481 RepID=UPI003519FAAC|nr:Fringe-like [Trypanosoma melophagium]
MLRGVRCASRGSKNKRIAGWWVLLLVSLLLSLLCWCLLAVSVDNGIKAPFPQSETRRDVYLPPLTVATGGVSNLSTGISTIGGTTNTNSNTNNNYYHYSGNRPWDIHHGSGAVGIGPDALVSCRSSICRLCDTMMVNNTESVIHPLVLAYIRKYVMIGIVTGSHDNFFRIDLALCTWLGHMAAENLFIFTDAANTSDGRHGIWIETDDAIASRQLNIKMLRRTGYSVGWMRAQYRFFHAFSHFAKLMHSQDGYYRHVRWMIVVDDDSFLDLHALVRFLHRRDLSNLIRLLERSKQAEPTLLQERCHYSVGATAAEISHCLNLPETIAHLQKQQEGVEKEKQQETWESMIRRSLFDPNSAALTIDSVWWNITSNELLRSPASIAALDPIYIGDRGWGGAGHYMNTAALRLFAERGEEKCVQRHLIKGRLASDTALHRCLPSLGIHRTSDGVLSHCQARYLQRRMLDGALVSMHAKRDVVLPALLAMWRMRLYYQVMYHRNHTAYNVLMQVGACAYGYTCKLRSCRKEEDAAALTTFNQLSNNNTHLPLY